MFSARRDRPVTAAMRCVRAIVLTACLLACGGVAAQGRIGFVDMKRLLDNAPQMATANERLREEFADRDRQLKADEARFTELQDRQRRESGLVTGQAAQALATEIEALDRRIRRTRDTLRDELRRRSEEELEQRWRQIQEAVGSYAREQNFDLIVSTPVLYASPAIDITDQVLARLRSDAAAAGNGNGR